MRWTLPIATSLILLSISLSAISLQPSKPSASVPSFPSDPSTTANPYVTAFQISQNSSDYEPFVISPASNKTAWVVTIQIRQNKPPLSQILNFTIGAKGWTAIPVLPQPLVNVVPNDIIYRENQGAARIWFVANDSLAYYDSVTKTVVIAEQFLNDSPQYMAFDPAGRIWITLLSTNRIAEYDPGSGLARFFAAPAPNSSLQGIAVAPDGSVWFAETYAKRLGHLIPCGGASCNITDYGPPSGIAIRFPIQVAVDSRGVVWFTDHGTNQFGSFNPATEEWRLLPIGYCSESYNPDCAIGLPNALAFDSAGRLWFSEHFAGRIAEYNPTTDLLTEYTVPATQIQYTWWMSPGPGNLVWFTSLGLGEIGYVNASITVPISMNPPNGLEVPIGSSRNMPVSIISQVPVDLGISPSSNDAPFGETPMLYGIPAEPQINTHGATGSFSLTISAGWKLGLGGRYVALTAYTDSVAMNTFIHVTVIQGLAHLAMPGLVSIVLIGGIGLYWRRMPKSQGKRSPKLT